MVADCLDGELFALSKSISSADAFSSLDRTTGRSLRSSFGMTFEPLTERDIEGLLTSFLEDFPARISAPREKGWESMGPAPASGSKWRESSVKFDLVTCLWKTHRNFVDVVLMSSSVTFPRSGMLQDGRLWERTKSELTTRETDSGYWRTPTASDGGAIRNSSKINPRTQITLQTQVLHAHLWPTPTAMDAGGFCGKPDIGRKSPNSGRTLTGKVLERLGMGPHAETFPTPRARDSSCLKIATQSTRKRVANGRARLDEYIVQQHGHGQLNPTWVEWLMGWPTGATNLKPLETGKFREWLQSHGPFLVGQSTNHDSQTKETLLG